MRGAHQRDSESAVTGRASGDCTDGATDERATDDALQVGSPMIRKASPAATRFTSAWRGEE